MGNNLSVTIQEGSAKELVELYNRLALEFETAARKVFPNVHWYCHPTTVKQVEDSRYHWACSRQVQVTAQIIVQGVILGCSHFFTFEILEDSVIPMEGLASFMVKALVGGVTELLAGELTWRETERRMIKEYIVCREREVPWQSMR